MQTVFEATINQAQGLRVATLPKLRDLDTAEDLAWYREATGSNTTAI